MFSSPRFRFLITPAFLFTVFTMSSCVLLTAEEGMYPISDIAQLNLREKGIALTPEEIFNPDQTCLVDGICRVNGCTGSFVSPDGLIITNHHCAYRAIQSASSSDVDYLRLGFQAARRAEEIYARGYTVRITESYRDVSDQVLSVLSDDLSFLDRTKAIEKRQKEIEKAAEADHVGQRAEVAEMFIGKTYVLFMYTYLKDVRLVFAPPAAIGNFGGEVDNWEWPRHTGDFSFMRAYVAPDGSSAEYSPGNVPYHPRRYIQVAPQGVDENDAVFLLGYPGRTARHKTASFLRFEQNIRLPAVVDIYASQIETMHSTGKDDRSVALKHAPRAKSLANVEKRSRGQLKGLQRAGLVESRFNKESELQDFIHQDAERTQKFGNLVSEIDAVYAERTQAFPAEFNVQNLRSACRALRIAYTIYDAAVERQKDDLDREVAYMDRNFDQTTKRLLLTCDDLHVPTDKLILRNMFERLAAVVRNRDFKYVAELPGLEMLVDPRPRSTDALIEELYASIRLTDRDFVKSCLQKSPDELAALDDPFLNWMTQLYPEYRRLREKNKEREGQLGQLYGSLIEIKKQFQQSSFVPDANGTLRMTIGRVRGYSPEDAVYKSPITTLQGAIDKTTGQPPFVMPEPVLTAYAQNRFGPFVHPRLKQVPTAILYDTDTTGGNSGSPILNAEGRLVGINFDRAFEATINDFAWNQSYSRSIGVDIRYALWITGTVYGADHLLHEMGVSK